jgi:hypothetical protein
MIAGEALLLEQRILQIPKPSQRTIEAFRSWFMGEHHGPEHRGSLLEDHSAKRFNNPGDLIVLSEPPGQDLLVHFVRRYFKVFFIVRVSHFYLYPRRSLLSILYI